MAEYKPDRWDHLTDEQLRGALFALRLFRTSPLVRGRALETLDMCIEELIVTMEQRHGTSDEGGGG